MVHTQLSATIQNTVLDNPTSKPKEAVLEKKNIDIPGGEKTGYTFYD